jgi:hypothetical protein
MNSFTVPKTACPACGHAINRAAAVGSPKPGDISVCLYCSGVSVVLEGGNLRQATKQDIDGLNAHETRLLAAMVIAAQAGRAAGLWKPSPGGGGAAC